MKNDIVLETTKINKIIKKHPIIKDVSLKLKKGDITGFIGPNGAGKTTMIKLMLGLQNYNSGTIKINDFDLKKEFTKAISNIGAIIETPDFYMYMSGYDNLKLTATLYNIDKKRIIEVTKIVGLEQKIHDKVKTYSLGMRQRLGIAQAIIHRPKILILDEPMNGLDPEGIKELKILLKKLATEEEISILISSHLLSELENICNHICILYKGKIIKDSTIEEITKITEKSTYILEIDNTDLNEILYNYKKIDNNHIKINTTKENLFNILKILIKNNINIYELKKKTATLEEIFIEATKKD